ncbi:MAG: type II secretion system protein [Akkermansia sp.]|nr:type II secretion system protein [Akkermansia sp.]
MKVRLNNRNGKLGFTLIELMVVIAILASVAAIGYPAYMKHMRDGELQKAQENLKSVHLMLTEFKQDHNSFPCDRSAEDLTEANPDINYGVLTGDYSNCYFRQLLYNKEAAEKNFYASISPGGRSTKEPNDKKAGGKGLSRGENAFAYVMRKSSDDPDAKEPVNGSNVPLAMCGIYPSDAPYTGDQMVFDNVSFGGKVLVLRTDGSVTDIGNDLQENEADDSKASMKQDVDIFPEKRNGNSSAPNYYVLSPEL